MRKLSHKRQVLLQHKDAMVNAYNKGGSLRDLALWYDTSIYSVRSILLEEGVPLKPRGRQTQKKQEVTECP